eukprot:scaffold1616_cov100-Skeletonema_dohrnii-CCMP3373.AAC.13
MATMLRPHLRSCQLPKSTALRPVHSIHQWSHMATMLRPHLRSCQLPKSTALRPIHQWSRMAAVFRLC